MDKEYQCLIVDDESVAQRIIQGYLMVIPGFKVVGTALNAFEAMEELDKNRIDIMFLDIEMPKLKGLAFLKSLEHPPAVILTTAHREYALQGYELSVIDYLLKPFSLERFLKALNRFKKINSSGKSVENITKDGKNYIYVKSDRKTLKINIEEIVYFEGMNNYIIIHLEKSNHIVYKSISEFLSELNPQFIRIHKSYVVNREWVRGYSKEVILILDKELPVGKAYKNSLQIL